MSSLLLHETTRQLIDSFIESPSHALLLHASEGCGKLSLANYLAARVLEIKEEALASYPYLTYIDAPAISSEAIQHVRKLEHFLSLRVPSEQAINRIVIVSDAQSLSAEAQNALLKTLEEPPRATLLIFTAHSPESLLPTIRSRMQSIAVKKPSLQQVKDHFIAMDMVDRDVDQAAAVSGGLPGLMTALLHDTDHPLKPATDTARKILQSPLYERLLLVDDLSKQKAHVLDVLFILQQMAHTRLQSTVGDQFNRWQQILKACYEANDQLLKSAQPKLVLDTLMLKLN